MGDLFTFRLYVLCAFVIGGAFVLGGKLALVQVVHGSALSERADRQYSAPSLNVFDRGNIFFTGRDGTLVSAATLKTGYFVALQPALIQDTHATFAALKRIIPELDEQAFLLRAGKKDDPYEEIARRLTKEDADAVIALATPGVRVYKEKWRVYPYGTLAAHTIGFVGYRDDTYGGRYGIERYYDDVLSRTGEGAYVNFFAEVFANIERSFFYENSREGDVALTIEPEVERMLEERLDGIMAKYRADLAGGIVIDPHTGAIRAMGVRPTFDPNTFSSENDYGVFLNPLVESVFEMGSIVKPLTVAAGIDTGVITPETTYTDKGYIVLNGARINNYDGKARGIVTMQEVLNQSLNTGVVFIQQKVGNERFARYFTELGFGEETGIDLPAEEPGLITNLTSTRDVEYATASFGQGIAMTPIEITRALSTLANKGVAVTPHVGDHVAYSLGRDHAITYGGEKRIFQEKSVEEVTRMLVKVVDTALANGAVKNEHYTIAAKTGTAQMAREDGKGYYDDQYLHSFFGYFPAYEPKFLIFFFIVNPKEVQYASQTLATPFSEMVRFLINYYEIPPDR